MFKYIVAAPFCKFPLDSILVNISLYLKKFLPSILRLTAIFRASASCEACKCTEETHSFTRKTYLEYYNIKK